MNKEIPLEQRAKFFLLENLCGNKKRCPFSNPEFRGEIEFLESHNYIVKENTSPSPHYAVTQKGIEFAAQQ